MAASIRHVRDFNKLLRKSKILRTSVEANVLNYCGSHSRFNHLLATNGRNGGVSISWKGKKPQICAVFIQRNNSQEAAPNALPTDSMYIPEPPPLPPPESLNISDTLNALGEPTFASLGLGNMTPPGLVQNALEFLHVTCGLPWWGSIVAGTIVLRLCMFPLVILSQRNVINMGNHMPTVQRLQEKMMEAKNKGDMLGATRTAVELRDYMLRNNVSPFKNFLVPLAQLPIFFSVFFGLRKMAYLPVESLKTGGLFWFTDLSVPDPFYALPIMTMLSLSATIELGTDGISTNQMQSYMRYFMRAMPFAMMFIVCNFPAAMCCYWFTSNTFSLCQVLFLKIPGVREYFKIPVRVIHPPHLQKPKLGFRESFKESYANSKMASEVENRRRADAMRFKKAGEGPIPKTYPFDPTKVTKIEAKSKS